MAKKITGTAELLFVEALSAGTVHITVRYRPSDLPRSEEPTRVVSGGAAWVEMAMTVTWTRCGEATRPQVPDGRHGMTDRFHDDQLCKACYRTLHPEDQPRAFEHRQPEDEDPWRSVPPAPAKEG